MKRVYEYGRAWDARLPRRAVKLLVGDLSVYTRDSDVIAWVRHAIKKSKDRDKFDGRMTQQTINFALITHHTNRIFYETLMKGDFRPRRKKMLLPATAH
jgi:hypothetical protein